MLLASVGVAIVVVAMIWALLNGRVRGRQWLDRHSDLLADLDSILASDSYIRHSDFQAWDEVISSAERELPFGSLLRISPLLLGKRTARRVTGMLRAGERVRGHNARYVESNLGATVFDTLLSEPLAHQQRVATLTDDDAVLVVAGAGTGKTSTLVAKVGYLIHQGVRPEEILVLTFLVKVGEELRERIGSLAVEGSDAVCVYNIHQFANRTIGKEKGGLPSVSPLAGDRKDSKQRSEFIQAVLDRLLRDDSRSSAWEFLLYNLPSPVYLGNGKKSEDYWLAWRKCYRKSLKGDYVRSREELAIADFLFRMGVEYEYERKYEHTVSTPEHRQYEPDFFLPEKQVYIEHFGLGHNDEPPPFFSENEKTRYLDDYRWKVETHRLKGTFDRLIQTFSRDARDGILLEKLERELESHGVTLDPLPPERLMKSKALPPRISALSELLSGFLELYREGAWTEERVLARAAELGQEDRMRRFLAVFDPVHEAYKAELSEKQEIDFADMLNMASEYFESHAIELPFRYCLVDEFQDISPGIVRFLRALQSQESRPRLFCIGDDWQSIYRFRAGDVSYVADSAIFENHFGFHQRLDLTSTFRLNDRLEDVTSTFIMKNESQGRKHLQTDPEKEATIPSVRVLMVEDSKGLADYRSGVERALALILEQESPVPPSVLVLDRYEKRYASQPSPEVALGIRDFMRAHRGVMQASFSTIHGSKGLECDFVILVGLENNLSRLSFPSCFSDDPILDTLLARPESFPDAEERRLFYVATTRAKEAVYLVAPRRYPSVFIRELDEDGSDVEWLDKLDSHTLPRCNECCSVGVVRLWQGVKWEGKQLHNFWKCNLCRARPKEVRCPCCAKGMVVLLNGLQPPYAKKCPSCGHVIPAEPERRSGFKPEHHEQPALDL